MCQNCAQRLLTLDRGPASPRSEWQRARHAERKYLRQLLRIARHIGDLTETGFNPADPASAARLEVMLRRYADTITPWAEAAGWSMVSEVAARDEREWFRVSREMGRALRAEISSAPTGMAMRTALAEQVSLIRSLPIEAAQRVHDLTLKGITEGTRASEIAAEIMRSGKVSASRANLIARTEVSRTASALTQARAEHIGSPGYFWRTAGDTDVRPSHKAMAGEFVAWNAPPTLDGMTGHAGSFPNCRCYPEPVLPEI